MMIDCLIGNLYVFEFNWLYDEFVEFGVSLVGIYVNVGVMVDEVCWYCSEFLIRFLVFVDEN